MAINVTVTKSDHGVVRTGLQRYRISAHLLVVDDTPDPDLTIFDSDVGVSWDGDNNLADLRQRLGQKMQGIVDRLVDQRAKNNTAAYSNMITWLDTNINP